MSGGFKVKTPGRIEYTEEQLQALTEKVLNGTLSLEERQMLVDFLKAFDWMARQLQEDSLTISRLRKIFGIQTEKTAELLKKNPEAEKGKTDSHPSPNSDPDPNPDLPSKGDLKKNADKDPGNSHGKGHGRIGADDYPGANKIIYHHPHLNPGDACPECPGKLYDTKDPGKVLTVKGMAPLSVTVYEYQKLRCNSCGKTYSPPLPPEATKEKFAASANSMICLLRYEGGFPMYRLEKLQKNFGMPIPVSTQWGCIQSVFQCALPVWLEIQNLGAQGEILYNDDTSIQILSLLKENQEAEDQGKKLERCGMFTSAIISIFENHKIMLFFSGRNHAGENLVNLLKKRDPSLETPIQMCDALSRNTSDEIEVILSHCLTHARRPFFELYDIFPSECLEIILKFREIYKNEAETKKQIMSPAQRLAYHQIHSAPMMDQIKAWGENQFKDKKVEPNSSLGKAIQYFLNHWIPLTEFLRTEKVPLTNDLCEQLIKTAIPHRKNSLFYKTLKGAMTGDCLMSLIQTAIQAKENPFDYLNALQQNETQVKKNPAAWLPWNYKKNLDSS